MLPDGDDLPLVRQEILVDVGYPLPIRGNITVVSRLSSR